MRPFASPEMSFQLVGAEVPEAHLREYVGIVLAEEGRVATEGHVHHDAAALEREGPAHA